MHWLTVKDIRLMQAMETIGPMLERDILRVLKRHARYLRDKQARKRRNMKVALSLPDTGAHVQSLLNTPHSPAPS